MALMAEIRSFALISRHFCGGGGRGKGVYDEHHGGVISPRYPLVRVTHLDQVNPIGIQVGDNLLKGLLLPLWEGLIVKIGHHLGLGEIFWTWGSQ